VTFKGNIKPSQYLRSPSREGQKWGPGEGGIEAAGRKDFQNELK
jgi:hypothetical protein